MNEHSKSLFCDPDPGDANNKSEEYVTDQEASIVEAKKIKVFMGQILNVIAKYKESDPSLSRKNFKK